MTKRKMTIEEAIEIFKEVREELIAKETELSKQVFENLGLKAVDLAIKILEQQPCEDCISREAVKDMLTEEWTKYMPMELDINLSFVLEKISELPSVTPKVDSKWGSIGKNTDLETVPTNLQDWLSTFNTESATECFTAVQRLKERVNEQE